MKAKTIRWDGHQIARPGMYSGLPLPIYHSAYICAGDHPVPAGAADPGLKTFGPSISSSGLRKIYGEEASPRHFYSTWQGNPNRLIKPDPRHFIVGRALHHLVLGEPFFAKLFCIQPDEWPDEHGVLMPWHNARTVCKKWHAERAKEGRAPLTRKEVESIKQMSISLGNHPLVRQGALNGAIERSIFWKDKETGIWLKSRPDAIPTDSAMFSDIKTTRSTFGPALSDTLNRFGYYRQIALVREACRIVLGMEMESFTLIFVEKDSPWSTRDIRVPSEDIDTGARENRAAIRTFHRCLKENRWPGPGEGNEGNDMIGLSSFARERRNTALKYEGLADNSD